MMTKLRHTFKALICLLIIGNSFAQQTPASSQSEAISITGGTAHLGDGTIIENATLVMEQGKIAQIGKANDVEIKGRVINAENHHLYPGFIIPNSTLGLGEVDAVRATRDFDELGEFLPHVRSLIAYNAESKVVESMRPNGVLLAQISPRGGRISGSSSIVQLDAWNWEDAAIQADDGMHINWPSSFKMKYASFGRIIISEPNKEYQKQVSALREFLINAKVYGKSGADAKNIPFDAAQGIFSGDQKVYVNANRSKEIIDALSLMNELGIKNIVLIGAEEAHMNIDLLKKYKVSVLLKRVHSLPENEDDDYDLPYKRAVSLVNNGILVGLENSGDMERMNSRNLPFYAGTTTSFGLDMEQALQLITLNTAKILGIDANYGSLEKGKSATLFISKGNALDMRTNQVSHAFIDGREISLETHQTELWQRYMSKYSE